MEKLIELLYKYNGIAEKKLGIITSVKQYGEEIWFDKEKEIRKYQEHIISKSYGFIKRLVDNDKIDVNEYPQIREYSDYESLLMYLSIQDKLEQFLLDNIKIEG